MKVREGFVSNSSSTSFVITNKTKKDLTLLDFVKENPQLVTDFDNQYAWHSHTQEEMEECATRRGDVFHPGKNWATYGDEDGDVLGAVLDYMLREYGTSENFTWEFYDSLR
jgi:hypothetical protein